MPSALQEWDDIDLIFFAVLCCCIASEGWVQMLIYTFLGICWCFVWGLVWLCRMLDAAS
jgi:hypothetical protein